ncbi:xanthine dehydrogenase family protein molybdopterin-binding subunit [Zobellia roscoffensis]|uniref:xanthine dehydrogenase family protein molybdopterin-binding subunit n=1 Tax=Zobellia roscoffensis TaxID=2779508 RepID=UPI00188A026C|nr:molybdopterin cofactor-binding domain-containing protein [Zobellia roscoffensis]
MISYLHKTLKKEGLSRRNFIQISSLSATGILLGLGVTSCGPDGKEVAGSWQPSVYLRIDSEGKVIITAHRSEMGQGIRTGLAMIVADELGADWEKVVVEQAVGDEKKYGNQNTDGSFSIRMYYQPLREAGATARHLLLAAAAEEWNVPASECEAKNGEVTHAGSGKSIGYGELTAAAAKLPVPNITDLKLKDTKDFTLIGKETPIVDLKDIVTGKAIYGIDAEVPNAKVAVIARCPVMGGSVSKFDDTAAKKIKGVLDIIELDAGGIPPQLNKPMGGIAVIAENTWAAIKGREALEITWDYGPNKDYDSEMQTKEMVKSFESEGTVRRKDGDVAKAMSGASKILDRTYTTPYFAHGMIEPPCALANVKDNTCEVWAPIQHPQFAKDSVVGALGLDDKNVTVNVTLLGGAFGRKSKPDFIVEAALLSQKSGHPIRLLWTREDDIHNDFLQGQSAHRIKVGLDKKNGVVAWDHHAAFPSIGATSNASVIQPSGFEIGMGATDLPFNIPNIQVETHDAKAHTRLGWLRSVCNIHNGFAIGSMVDEIAVTRGMDAKDNLLDLIGPDRSLTFDGIVGNHFNYGESLEDFPWETARLKNVIERAAKEANWGQTLPKGQGQGIAAFKSFLTYVACVVRVAVDEKGNLTIPEVHYALDCGVAVNVDRIKAQFEGGAIFGTSLGMMSKISYKDGRAEQDNFDGYRIARMPESPIEVKVHIVESSEKPTGIGEPPIPPFVPALCNAIYAATGKRITSLPIDLANTTA